MPDSHQRELERAYAWQQLSAAFAAPDRTYSIHYALQRLQRGRDAEAPPVAAIAVRQLATGNTTVFSIKAEADAAGIDLSAHPSSSQLAAIEYSLLFKFNDFLSRHRDHYFLHWYMRDERFGFLALEERHRKSLSDLNAALYGTRSAATAAPYGFAQTPGPFPIHLVDANRIDLAMALRHLYGFGPARLRDLADANRLSHAEMIEGINEPEMFERGNYGRLEWSSASKARLIAELSRLAYTGSIVPARDTTQRQQPEPQPGSLDGLRVFINYRREDTEAAANWLHELLSDKLGTDNVFIDTDDIPAGLDFVEYLRRQIESCDVFLVMIGRRWLASADEHGRQRLGDPNDYVRAEIRAALARDIPVIPVLVGGTPMPPQVQIPADILPLRRRQAVELSTRSFRQDADNLVAKIREATRVRAEQRRQQSILG